MKGKSVFKSPRFIAGVVSLMVMVLVAYVPQLQPLENALVQVIVDVINVFLP